MSFYVYHIIKAVSILEGEVCHRAPCKIARVTWANLCACNLLKVYGYDLLQGIANSTWAVQRILGKYICLLIEKGFAALLDLEIFIADEEVACHVANSVHHDFRKKG